MSTLLPDDESSLDRIDREIRLNEAWHEADRMAREEVESQGLTGEKAEREIAGWRDLYAFDTAPDTCEHEILRAEGVDLPPAAELDEAELRAKLWEVIQTLAARNTFLHNTDHLSDRELYANLVEETFFENTKDMPVQPGCTHGLDMIGGGSEEDIDLMLRYYSSDEDRDIWAKSWPKDPMPPKEKPPYDRDRLLPKSPFG